MPTETLALLLVGEAVEEIVDELLILSRLVPLLVVVLLPIVLVRIRILRELVQLLVEAQELLASLPPLEEVASAEVLRILDRAKREVDERGDDGVALEHILNAIALEPAGAEFCAGRVLTSTHLLAISPT